MSEIPGWSGLEPPVEAARRQRSLILRVVRASFFTLIATFTLLSVIQSGSGPGTRELANNWWVYTLAAVLFFGLALLVDLLTPNKKISTMSGVMFGLLAGLLATLALGLVIDLVLATWVQPQSALDTLKPADLGVDVAPRLKTLKVVEPPRRKGGVMVKDVAELVAKLKSEAKVI